MNHFLGFFIFLCLVFAKVFISLSSITGGVLLIGILLLFAGALAATRKSGLHIVVWMAVIGISFFFNVHNLRIPKQVLEEETQSQVTLPPTPGQDMTPKTPIILSFDEQLIDAIQKNDPTLVKKLLRAGANPNAKTPDGKPAINEAFSFVSDWTLPIVEALVQAGADVNSYHQTFTPLMMATIMKQGDLIDFLLANGADVNAQQERTALMLAAEGGDVAIAQKLIKAGADVNRNYRDYTALQESILRKDLPMVQLLLDNGADVNFGITWLFALKWGTPQITETLVKKGMVMPNDTNRLALKAYSGDLEALKTGIAAYRANGKKDPVQERVLHALLDWAIAGGQTETARFLLTQKISPELPSSLEMASLYGRTEIVNLLFATGVAFPEENLLTALRNAVEQGRVGAAQVLLEKGADPNKPAPNSFGAHFLEIAARRGDLEMVKTLLAAKADPNQANTMWNDTALHKAVEADNLEIVKVLIAAGAKPNPQNNWKQTPLSLALKTQKREIASFLRQAGATE